MHPAFAVRRAGVLLHPTSLPGPGTRGTLGKAAYGFIDWLAAGGFSLWQTLPLGPTDAYGSPYCLRSAFAGDARLIDAECCSRLQGLPVGLVIDQDRVVTYRSFCALASSLERRAFAAFVRRHAWLPSYAAFELCREQQGGRPWWEWPSPYRDRERAALNALLRAERERFRALMFEQYVFALQWAELKRYANERDILLFGDLPFYVDRDSVEIWAQRSSFALDERGEPRAVAGVPPDYFNAAGQLWGNPLYDWEALRRTGFRWWIARLAAQFERFDLVRIDHFRALQSYWEIPAGAVTARAGAWRLGPGEELLTAVRTALGSSLPLVAEDLGVITDDVRRLRDQFELPGMVVLQFAFDGSPDNPHLPQHHGRNAVVYTGTHDNDTTVGWYRNLGGDARAVVHRMLGLAVPPLVPDFLIESAYASSAALAVVPMQDLLALDSTSRMNTPGSVVDNWRWRFEWGDVPADLASRCRERAARTGRLAQRSELYSAS